MKENKDIIREAFCRIQNSIDTSLLSDNEKNLLKIVVEKLIAYYDKRMNIVAKKGISVNSYNEKVIVLQSFMTDTLVDINNIIKGKSDLYYYVGMLNKRLNDKEVEKMIKSKK